MREYLVEKGDTVDTAVAAMDAFEQQGNEQGDVGLLDVCSAIASAFTSNANDIRFRIGAAFAHNGTLICFLSTTLLSTLLSTLL